MMSERNAGCPWCRMSTDGQHEQHCPNHPRSENTRALPWPSMGWQCPRCFKVWAPWVQQCNCMPEMVNGVVFMPSAERGGG